MSCDVLYVCVYTYLFAVIQVCVCMYHHPSVCMDVYIHVLSVYLCISQYISVYLCISLYLCTPPYVYTHLYVDMLCRVLLFNPA